MSELDMKSLLDVSGLPGFDGGEVVVYEPTVLLPVESNPLDRAKDLSDDYSLARQALNQQQQMIMAMAAIALENAKNSESPNQVNAFTQLMGTWTANTKEILKLHKEMDAITAEKTKTGGNKPETPSPSMNIENATVFMGTPAELMLREGTQTQAQSLVIDGESEEVKNAN
ncbi:terminase DNA packaging enzyme small subunit [Aeromonas phage AS-zj]|uniref:Terminase DNA packaging enzyme small subunit n=4 Tax=Caudoviricetes TaxID=2731619 RepID=A0A291LDF9_9CAUD|nr:terminase small subunit [Aeromonas phage AS-zj]ATI17419.1 terminase DNA packaging enzyme small subunit [Aeromonas phage AS-szw]QAX97859.1 terminase DNA packaging enzyme small subunit [Aeromonas phage Asswx_1]QAX99090.1 terminase DNA packaging enzyme small subunit [Aeromonas phage Assk]UKM62901.1 putative terminase DNA packaging enzyme small subunit [Aeromonas phage P19]ASU00177.1 terminase DNA packaging enzyme small subunit [Aeromonas phage AS-zj]